jgi:DNA-binding response OmpR family regulator
VCQILIVEDELRIASFMDKGLRRYGYETAIARDGVTAIEMILHGNFHLLLLDLGLPGKDGWEVLQELQNSGKKPHVIIVITARDDFQERIKGIGYGIDDYIVKPFRFADLLVRVQEKLENT